MEGPGVFILDASRTPIGKFGRSLAKIPAPELAGSVIAKLIKRNGIDKSSVEEVIMGNVLQGGVGQNPAGQAAKHGGLPDTVVKYTVNVVCASGMLAVESAAREISLGEKDLIIAGGMESMSRAPLLIPSDARWGVKQLLNRKLEVQDAMLNDGLLDAFYGEHMGLSAERSARKFGISRKEADLFALRSFELAEKAMARGETAKEITELNQLKADEGLRKTSLEDLAALPQAFSNEGVLTAGNSSQISDGASALILCSERYLKETGKKPIAKITGFASASLDPRDFVEAPIPATRDLIKRKGMKIEDFDLVEHNEAFSVASIIVQRELGIDEDRFNVNGGAIAIGHPLGNSGSRIIVTLLNALRSRKMEKGLATICHGGGGGHSLSLEVIY
ncbi:MAG TPA: acetyl-CoA C-acyltransferase [Thermoplasmataceae archaeon]|nr:acetyl-CoA C-acyltransferase [Thermoplasmatales archaeon AK]HLH86314.1 acetyl-CoA C-acyltransferase [Thermoplasmataceae archaeon]